MSRQPENAIAPLDWKDAQISSFEKAIDPLDLKKMAEETSLLQEYNSDVYDARQRLKKKRVLIEKEGKRLRDSTNEFNRMVINKEKELIAIIGPEELRLKKLEDDYYAEKERIRKEEEQKENDRIQAMIDALNKVNAAVDYATLKGMTDDQFIEYLQQATHEYNEAEKLKELELKRKLEEEAVLKAQQEAVRIEAEKLAKIKKDLQDAQDKIEAEKKALEAEQEAIRINAEKLMEQERQRKIQAEKALEEIKRQQEKAEEKRKLDIRTYRANILIGLGWEQTSEKLEEYSEEEFDNARQILKAKQAKKQAEEAERLEKERLEQEQKDQDQKYRFFEDSQRFGHLAQQLNINYIQSPVWGYMKSEKGKKIGYEVLKHIRIAWDLCEEHKDKTPEMKIPDGITLD